MTGVLEFGALLPRLTAHRSIDLPALAAAVGATAAELPAVLDGQPPSGQLLRDLAPALGLHAADLAALGGLDLPDDLAPLSDCAADVAAVIREARRLTTAQLDEVRRTSRALTGRAPLPR